MSEIEGLVKNRVKNDYDRELIFSLNKSRKIIKFNNECEKILGFAKYQAVGSDFFELLVPKKYYKEWKNIFSSILSDKQIDDFILPVSSVDGNERMISWSVFPVVDKDRNIIDVSFVGKYVKSDEGYLKSSDLSDVSNSESEHVSADKNGLNLVVQKLEKENEQLERKYKNLEENINSIKNNKKQESKKINKWFNFSNFFKSKDDEEKANEIDEIEEKEKYLKRLESELEEDKRSLNEQREWFIKWREKLEDLEYEIEKRRMDVKRKENLGAKSTNNEPEGSSVGESYDSKGLIEDIDDCAVVIQRGILKDANSSFADLLGYNVDEVLNKSLFDFIDFDGFSGIEDYYLDRLKGGNVSNYETVFVTKDNIKIPVEVSTRTVFSNNEKYEVAIVKRLNKSYDKKK